MDMDDGAIDEDSLDISSLNNLRVLSVIRVGRWMENSLGKLTNLRKLGVSGDMYLYENVGGLDKLSYLKSLRLGFGFGDSIPNLERMFSSCSNVNTLFLERRVHNLPDADKFSRFLTKLCLKWTLLEQDPMPTLEQLSNLRALKLGFNSFLGKGIVCSAEGFPKLQFLGLNLLDGLQELTVEKETMSRLERLIISLCNRLEMLPKGLLHLHHFRELEVTGMTDAFNARLQCKVGEDWFKIQHVPSVVVDRIQMGPSTPQSHLQIPETSEFYYLC